MTEGKMAHLLPVPPVLKQVIHHDMERGERELGPVYKLLDQQLVPGADITVHIRHVQKEPPKDFKPHVEAHKHDVSSVYCFLGDLKVEMTLEDEKYIISAPRAAYIPPGVMHTWIPLSGTGYIVVILKEAQYA